MKSEERHELKTNELAEWIANFPEWAKENTSNIAYVAIVIIIVGVVAYLKWYRPAHTISREQIEMSQLAGQLEMAKVQVVSAKDQASANPEVIRGMADRLGTVAGQLSQPEYAASALIKQGEALRAELHYAPAGFAADPNALAFQVNKAKMCYQQAVEKAGGNPQLAAMAQFGLGLCAEEVGNFEEAQKIYHDITANGAYAGTVIVSMARERATDMNDYKGTFVFVETAQTPAAPAMPEMPLGPRVENLPPKAVTPAAVPAAVKPAESNAPAAK
jgi:tetratricopeptide (TPR) repeat protein